MMQLENENGIERNWFERAAALIAIYLCLSVDVCVSRFWLVLILILIYLLTLLLTHPTAYSAGARYR